MASTEPASIHHQPSGNLTSDTSYSADPHYYLHLGRESSMPHTIVLLTTGSNANGCTQSARHKHIAKYLVQYQALYPDSEILLLESSMANLAWTSDAAQMRNLRPTLNTVKEILRNHVLGEGSWARDTGKPPKEPIVLVHAFSNGGAHNIVQLAQAYREHMAGARTHGATPWARTDLPAELPVSALILDSSPGRADYDIGIKVVQTAIPSKTILSRLLVTVVAHVVISSVVVAHKMGFAENVASKLWRCLNDINGPFLVKREGVSRDFKVDGESVISQGVKIVPRTYIYSTRDYMVPWQGVLEHAEETRQVLAKGLKEAGIENGNLHDVIGLQGFSGSAHVNHMQIDPGRYWKLVRKTVEKVD